LSEYNYRHALELSKVPLFIRHIPDFSPSKGSSKFYGVRFDYVILSDLDFVCFDFYQ